MCRAHNVSPIRKRGEYSYLLIDCYIFPLHIRLMTLSSQESWPSRSDQIYQDCNRLLVSHQIATCAKIHIYITDDEDTLNIWIFVTTLLKSLHLNLFKTKNMLTFGCSLRSSHCQLGFQNPVNVSHFCHSHLISRDLEPTIMKEIQYVTEYALYVIYVGWVV